MIITQDSVAVKINAITSISLITHGTMRYSVYVMMVHGGSIKIAEYKTKEEAKICFDKIVSILNNTVYDFRGEKDESRS